MGRQWMSCTAITFHNYRRRQGKHQLQTLGNVRSRNTCCLVEMRQSRGKISLRSWIGTFVGATKKTVVIAFGGGAVLNIAGLFASIAYRGMKLLYVPTTLLAMHDVVTSLKTSICFDGRKNNIGSYYAPLKILIEVGFCRTLPRNELFSGLGELAKNAALFGGAHAEGFLAAMSKETIDGNNGGSGEEFSIADSTMVSLVRLGIEAKMQVLRVDALEKQSGMVF